MTLESTGFPMSRALVPRLDVLDEVSSTNDVVRERAEELPSGSVVITNNQTGGRGRLGRVWVAPPGKTLAVSMLLRLDELSEKSVGWLPLLAGLAMSRAMTEFTTKPVSVKWPNDVLIDERKVCGILTELLPDRLGVIVGSGVNLSLRDDDLPVETATSLFLASGSDPDPDAVLAAYLTEFHSAYRAFRDHGGDAHRSGLHDAVSRACGTLGRRVRVVLPGDRVSTGVAVRLDETGRLIVDAENGQIAVAAGDVTHVRY